MKNSWYDSKVFLEYLGSDLEIPAEHQHNFPLNCDDFERGDCSSGAMPTRELNNKRLEKGIQEFERVANEARLFSNRNQLIVHIVKCCEKSDFEKAARKILTLL